MGRRTHCHHIVVWVCPGKKIDRRSRIAADKTTSESCASPGYRQHCGDKD
jgi:hypothetical protein